jgi:Na+/H+ antiporter NhaD/arsenite permease-like protein
MGILLGLGLIWFVVDLLHKQKDDKVNHEFTVHRALQKIEVSSILFFLDILLAVVALECSERLNELSS